MGNGGADHQRQHLPGVTESNSATIQENDEIIEAYRVDDTTTIARGSNDGRINSAASAAGGGGSGIPDIVYPAQVLSQQKSRRSRFIYAVVVFFVSISIGTGVG